MNIYLLFILAFASSFIFGFLYRWLLKKIAVQTIQKRARKNIGQLDRIFRFSLGVLLLIWGFYSTSFWLLFFSGFSFFESLFSWCGFYALTGKNTCPL
jgi:hypothetical protein